jgi:glycosyltransferase involved in cell wall biosynthesis
VKICFLGLENLPVLAPEYNVHGIGGEQVQHTLLAKALTRAGHQVSMVVYDYGQADGKQWDGITTFKAYRADSGVPVVRYLHPRWTGVWSALLRADADVYYVSCAGMHLGLLTMFCKRHNKRVIFRVAHDRDCEPNNLLIKYWRDKKLYEYGLRNCDVVLVQSEQQRQAMRRNYGVDSVIAEMPVELPAETVPSIRRSTDVLWVNNIRQFKRPDLFLHLAKEMPDISFKMVGGPQPGFAELYDQISKEAKAITNLNFCGRVPYHDVGGMYADAKIFVNTSESEGFPNSFLQSWIRGTPVVSFFDPDGIIASEGVGASVTSLATMQSAIRSFLQNGDLLESTGKRCKVFMEERYGESRILVPYLAAFGEKAA